MKIQLLTFLLKILISGIIAGIIVSILIPLFVMWIHRDTPITNNILIIQIQEKTLMEKINDIAVNVSQSHEYKFQRFDCTQYSEELVKALNQTLNISAYCIYGIYGLINAIDTPVYPYHSWVEVKINNKTYPIEATTGEYIDEDIYKEKYRIIKRGICV